MKARKDFLPFSRPDIGEGEIEKVTACLRSGWITTGPLCAAFEEGFSRLTGAKGALSLSSATAGMHLLLRALEIGEGDEVITPSLTFASTVNMIALAGAVPVFADVHYGTLNMDPGSMEERITARTKAVVPVHFAGAPADMARILEIAGRHGLAVIEDAAHAVGTTFGGTHAGGFGRPAVFSFHPIKNITTGEGGMITLSDPELERKLRLLRFHGIERDAWKRYGKGGNPEYDIASPGFKYNMTDLHAAIGLAQLERVDALNGRRKSLAERYLDGLSDIAGIDPPGVPSYPHGHPWHLFVVKVTGMPRDRFFQRLSEFNVGYGLHFPAAHRLRYVRERYGEVPCGLLKETERAAERIVSLPLFPGMSFDDVDYVCDAIREILKNG